VLAKLRRSAQNIPGEAKRAPQETSSVEQRETIPKSREKRSMLMSEFDQLESVEIEVAPVLALQIPGECGCDPSEIGPAIQTAFGTLGRLLKQHELVPAAPPRSVYTAYSTEGMRFVVAMPIASPPAETIDGEVAFVDTLAGGKTLRFTHRGPYTGLMRTYGQITRFMQAKGLMETEADWARYMPMWEEYLNDPEVTPEAELLTHIYLPLP
jgi:effector-binding domain-containing protein